MRATIQILRYMLAYMLIVINAINAVLPGVPIMNSGMILGV